jgi:hypothetical protein
MVVKAPSHPAEPPGGARWIEAESSYVHIPGMDPYVEWAVGAGRAHFFKEGRQQRWLPVAIRLNGISPREFADGNQFVEDGQSLALWRASVRVSPLYTSAERSKGEIFCTAMVSQGFFEFMKRNGRLRDFVARVTVGLPLDRESLPPNNAAKEAGNGSP